MDEDILLLFEKAKLASSQELANKYVKLARTRAMKRNIRLPKSLQQLFCKHCYTFFNPEMVRVRKQEGAVVYTCKACSKQTRILI